MSRAIIKDTRNRVVNLSYTNTKLTSMTDWTGRTWQYGYAANGKLGSYIHPDGKVTQYNYGSDGNIATIVDPRGNSITLTYDATDSGRPLDSRRLRDARSSGPTDLADLYERTGSPEEA